jgi:hypothetical protein
MIPSTTQSLQKVAPFFKSTRAFVVLVGLFLSMSRVVPSRIALEHRQYGRRYFGVVSEMSKILWAFLGVVVLSSASLPATAQVTTTGASTNLSNTGLNNPNTGLIPLFQTQQSTYLGPTAPGANATSPASAGIYVTPAGTIIPGTTATGPTIYTGPTAAGNTSTVVNATGNNTSASTTATGTSTSTGAINATGSAPIATPAGNTVPNVDD